MKRCSGPKDGAGAGRHLGRGGLRRGAAQAAVALMVLAGPLAADVKFSKDPLDACLAQGSGAACIGKAADACMAATPGGDSTAGMAGCLEAEFKVWDARLNAAYEALRKDLSDAQEQASALHAMQRAWIGYRDATCAWERALVQGGTAEGPAANACMMRVTGQQALYLEAQRDSR